ncbi:MAG: DNA/RNA nuclease SfsA [Planctomycetes bacterium]|nr:DNA/RNA nuclease SfsA [Planctomycetota bacterium]
MAGIQFHDFGPLVRSSLIDRPNRFIANVRLSSGGKERAFLPNPGRLRELFLPGVELLLSDSGGLNASGAERKTRYTVSAINSPGGLILLNTHATNAVARELLVRKMIPGLEQAEIIKQEAACGHSRFDFLMRESGREFFLEVKSVTLFGNGAAMFPDAVTERGRRHLLELAELSDPASPAAVIFVVHSPATKCFMPDYHTDLEFSKTLLDVRHRLRIIPVAVGYTPSLRLKDSARLLPIPWDYLEGEVVDSGAYLFMMNLKKDRALKVGGLGEMVFRKGWYVYVGSAMKNLTPRVNRHLRKRKTMKWHVDYLRNVADEVEALPIRSSRRRECEIASAADKLFAESVKGFGCSDCGCESHLFYSKSDPRKTPAFYGFLHGFRMDWPK